MTIKIKPKSFGPVFVIVNQEGKLEFTENLDQTGQNNLDISSPAISLLYSLGSCVALSLQGAAASKKTSLQPFHVTVSSEKARDLPFRFEDFKVHVSGKFVEDDVLARELLDKAKTLCTVSNTLNARISLTLDD